MLCALPILSALTLLLSCGKQEIADVDLIEAAVAEEVQTVSGEDAVEGYYDVWKDLTLNLLDSNPDAFCEMELPELGAPAGWNIKDREGNPVGFADLPPQEQSRFIREVAKYMAMIQKKKVVQASVLGSYFGDMYNVARDLKESPGGISFLKQYPVDVTVVSSTSSGPDLQTKGIFAFGPSQENEIPYEKFAGELAGVVKKGDFCVTLSIHRKPLVLVNLTNLILDGNIDHRFTGHSGMFVEDFGQDVAADSLITLAASWDGVGYEPISNWSTELYVLEIKEMEYIWDPSGENPLTVNRKSYPLQKRDEFIAYAKQHLGVPFLDYTKIGNWVTFKNLAPNTFVCSSLLWWCVRNVYGVDMSIPFLSFVSPSRILLNPYTDIKKIIE